MGSWKKRTLECRVKSIFVRTRHV